MRSGDGRFSRENTYGFCCLNALQSFVVVRAERHFHSSIGFVHKALFPFAKIMLSYLSYKEALKAAIFRK